MSFSSSLQRKTNVCEAPASGAVTTFAPTDCWRNGVNVVLLLNWPGKTALETAVPSTAISQLPRVAAELLLCQVESAITSTRPALGSVKVTEAQSIKVALPGSHDPVADRPSVNS